MKAEPTKYAVFLFPQGVETLGAAIKPYISDAPAGPHIVCSEVDTAGAFFQLTVPGQDQHGNEIDAELMLPSQFIKLIVSIHNDRGFGFSEN
jgi:hypothetical protein